MKDETAYFAHIAEAITRIKSYTKNGRKDFFEDPKTQDSVIRQLEIIGEAVKNISANTRNKDETIPWKQIAGMRDKLIHQYFGVDLKLVWDVVENHLSELESFTKVRLNSPK